jgi:hypothetical protein
VGVSGLALAQVRPQLVMASASGQHLIRVNWSVCRLAHIGIKRRWKDGAAILDTRT